VLLLFIVARLKVTRFYGGKVLNLYDVVINNIPCECRRVSCGVVWVLWIWVEMGEWCDGVCGYGVGGWVCWCVHVCV